MKTPGEVWQIVGNEIYQAYWQAIRVTWERLQAVSLLDFLRVTPTSFPFTEGFWEALGILSAGLETFTSRLRQIPARLALSYLRDAVPVFGKGRSRALSAERAYKACFAALTRSAFDEFADVDQKQAALKSIYNAQRVGSQVNAVVSGKLFTKSIRDRILSRVTGLAMRAGFAISQAILLAWDLASVAVTAAVFFRMRESLKAELLAAAFQQKTPRKRVRLARGGTIYRRAPGGNRP